MSNSKLAKDLLEAVRRESGTKPYDTTAEVLRVENGIAWIHIDGGASETPCELTIDAKAGDKVKVRIAGGSAWLIGNTSAPPTDDTTANAAKDRADNAYKLSDQAIKDAERASEAADSAEASADSAQTSAKRAILGLEKVEDVVNVVEWIANHGVYVLTGDQSIVLGKRYYTVVGTAVENPTDDDIQTYYELSSGIYTKTTDVTVDGEKTYHTVIGTVVNDPVVADIGAYYELDIRDAVSNYIQSHLLLVNEGLYVMQDKNDWKVLISNNGMEVLNPQGESVSRYGENARIGQNNASRVVINDDSIEMYTDEGNMAFQVLLPAGAETEYQEVTKTYGTTVNRVLKNGVTTSNTTTTGTFTFNDLDDVETSGEYSDFTLSGGYSSTIASHSQNGSSTEAMMAYIAFKTWLSQNGATKQGSYSFTFTKNGTQQTKTKSFTISYSSNVTVTGTITITYNGLKTFTVTFVVKKTQSSYINTTVNAYTNITQLVYTQADVPIPETDIFGNVYLNASTFGDTFVNGDAYLEADVFIEEDTGLSAAITALGWGSEVIV